MELVFDIEANGLYDEADTIWCMVARDLLSGKRLEWTVKSSSTLNDFLTTTIQKATKLIGHNIINYDLPLLTKVTGWTPDEDTQIVDTLVMSRLGNPDRPRPPGYTGKGGPHGLEAWGYRVGKGKPHHEEWDVFSPAMLRRCREDVEINVLTYSLLSTELEGENWKEPLAIEQRVADIITRQERGGILFDKSKAEFYVKDLTDRIQQIDDTIVPLLPHTVEQIGTTVREPFKKTGDYRKQTQDYLDEAYPDQDTEGLVNGPYTRIRLLPFNIGSTEKVKQFLLDSGWIPDSWNISKSTGERTSPKLEGEFRGVTGEIPRAIKERITWRHRRSQIEGWLSNVRPDGRIPAGGNPCGTNTGRFRHTTVVNIPKANVNKETHELEWDTDKQKDVYGTQMRSLFTVPQGYTLVGHDASGLELRMLAHYMNDPEFTKQILEGDIHEFNRANAGLPDRNSAKTFIYGFLYGAGNAKIGSIVGGTADDGAELKDRFLNALPKLDRLINSVKRASGKGYLKGLDGRLVHMRRGEDGRIQRNRALNTLLQSAGAIVMKKSMIILDDMVKSEGLRVQKVLDMHDEAQAEVHNDDVERYMELAVLSIVKAGEHFNLNIPLDGEAKAGKHMAHTH